MIVAIPLLVQGLVNVPFPASRIADLEDGIRQMNATAAILAHQVAQLSERLATSAYPSPPTSPPPLPPSAPPTGWFISAANQNCNDACASWESKACDQNGFLARQADVSTTSAMIAVISSLPTVQRNGADVPSCDDEHLQYYNDRPIWTPYNGVTRCWMQAGTDLPSNYHSQWCGASGGGPRLCWCT